MIGSVVGARYKILRRLGEGGMGEVFLAEHIGLARKEAIKVLKSTVAADPNYVSRFRREARATNRVQHPNIVGIYDFGQLPDGRMFLAMEYAEGLPLREVLEQGPLAVDRAVSIGKQLATAIEHAHACGVIHRDIKPENLILCKSGKSDLLKVLDFGLAKIIHPDHKESIALTKKGDILGTALYMAPEQYQSKANDPRSDLYAMGCVLYEMLVGRPPFEGGMMELMVAHTSRAPGRPSQQNYSANIPPDLDAIVLRCLEKDPDNRFQSGGEIIAALEDLLPSFVDDDDPSYQTIRIPKMRFDDGMGERTLMHWGVQSNIGMDAMATAQTEAASLDELIQAWRGILREFAERLLDGRIGSNGTGQLSVAIARVVGLDDEVARMVSEQEALTSARHKLDQSTRERGASLRFAVGELQFDRDQLSPESRGEIDFQIDELSKRYKALTEEAEARSNQLVERSVALAGIAHQVEQNWAAAYDRLESLVEALLPTCDEDAELGAMVEHYKSTRTALARVRANSTRG